MYLEKIKEARENIKDVVTKTPLLYSNVFSKSSNNEVYMKCENLQLTGAYKLRGALNKIISLSEEEKAKGVICSSAGNHAQGVAYASSLMGVESSIVMPETTPYLKVESTKNYGGNIILHGKCYDDAFLKAKTIEEEEGKVFIHPFNDIDVICGQGTIALEIFEEINDLDYILVPIGGGGLISGISVAAKSLNPNIKIIGVQAEGAPSMALSIKKDKICTLDSVNTIADGISVKTPGSKTFEIVREYVDDIITVSENDIVNAFLLLVEKHKLVAEASGVVTLAALKKLRVKNKKVCCILSGGNIDMLTISTLINNGLVSKGRLFCFSIELKNVPGELLKISEILAKETANVVKLEHNQFKAINRIHNVLLEVTVETNGHEHIEKVINSFEREKYSIRVMY
ncbi:MULTISPECIES: threonine ammonia-lyase [unclassified Clostridium]|uniref:threonine ammonia-lyase n=1 Tax=unclassified Clostridium TaxID=2614128 RepID=UPI001C8BC15E|nr:MULTISPECIES: threonine ammonia-lyase [unclassified Clostridium]MBX9136156.1 threonine ammonia-lyase [Clostridium sp. K12(2020)]MBX9143212.1 threonine ammonia-lyase [Clostridium sp. K13]